MRDFDFFFFEHLLIFWFEKILDNIEGKVYEVLILY